VGEGRCISEGGRDRDQAKRLVGEKCEYKSTIKVKEGGGFRKERETK